MYDRLNRKSTLPIENIFRLVFNHEVHEESNI